MSPTIPLLDGERQAFVLKLMVEMDAIPSGRAQSHNVRTLYWSGGGARPLAIVDKGDVSGVFGIQLKGNRRSAHS